MERDWAFAGETLAGIHERRSANNEKKGKSMDLKRRHIIKFPHAKGTPRRA
jgi:hypothetical protein